MLPRRFWSIRWRELRMIQLESKFYRQYLLWNHTAWIGLSCSSRRTCGSQSERRWWKMDSSRSSFWEEDFALHLVLQGSFGFLEAISFTQLVAWLIFAGQKAVVRCPMCSVCLDRSILRHLWFLNRLDRWHQARVEVCKCEQCKLRTKIGRTKSKQAFSSLMGHAQPLLVEIVAPLDLQWCIFPL